MKYSTTPSNDPDTHEYFRSTSKAKSDLSVKDIVEQDVKNNPVMMYIKWIPEMHICGFSALAVRVLKEYLQRFVCQITQSVAAYYHHNKGLKD
ncbi:hypothetical protein SOVF_070170 [Spinacia oleracea]|nr:hypothetical protein SOVF_070170 [Spinacia oleracea]